MKYRFFIAVTFIILMLPVIASAQADTTKKDTATVAQATMDTAVKAAVDTTIVAKADTAIVATPMNCYKQYIDYFAELGAKPVTDGMQLIVIAFKSKESCHCYMGKVEVAGGKIKAPLYVQTEGGEFKTFTQLGKKLDADFLAVQGDELWNISNGMSAVFQTADQEYGRVFFYKFLNKNKQMTKEAPSPADLVK